MALVSKEFHLVNHMYTNLPRYGLWSNFCDSLALCLPFLGITTRELNTTLNGSFKKLTLSSNMCL